MNREEITKDCIRFLQTLSISGGINDVAMKKVFEKVKQLQEELE